MINDCLLYFRNPTDFSKFITKLNIYGNWKIGKGTMNKRGENIKDKGYTRYLRKRFNDKRMFRNSVSISEIVSWLDSFVIMKRFFDKLEKQTNDENFSEIKLYTEYMIKMSKKMRVDFVIRYKNTILLIEFRMVNDYTKIKPTWSKKKLELLVYKELLENYIESNTKILTFAFISLYEYDNKVVDNAHLEYNNNQIDFLIEYFIKFVLKREQVID